MDIIFQIILNNFEGLMLFLLFWVIIYLAVWLVLKIQQIKIKIPAKRLHPKELALSVIAWSGIFIVGFMFFIYMYNHIVAPKKSFSASIRGTTHWADGKQKVFFISGKQLVSVKTNGGERRVVFESDAPLREYHFSPDGKHILLVSYNKLFHFKRSNGEAQLITALDVADAGGAPAVKGVIDGVRWSPDSRRFCYRLYRWSGFSSNEQWQVYTLAEKNAAPVQNRNLSISSLWWTREGDRLMYLKFQGLDPAIYAEPGEVKVYEVALADMRPRHLYDIPFVKNNRPIEVLANRGINLFIAGEQLSFGRTMTKRTPLAQSGNKEVGLDPRGYLFSETNDWWNRPMEGVQQKFDQVMEMGYEQVRRIHWVKLQHGLDTRSVWNKEIKPRLGVDAQDLLYYVPQRWLRKHLYRIPRLPKNAQFAQEQFSHGDYVVRHLRWLPQGRYVIMEHYYYGILLLDPSTGRIGILDNERSHTYGWWEPVI